jgi:hypothetical protein
MSSDADPVAREQEIARWQRCAIEEVTSLGGEVGESFWLINAFTAELTLAQATQLSTRGDVQSVELSNPGTPPSGMP